jgi:hypothetical protein
MDNEGKRKSFTICDKINILAQVDAHIGALLELVLCLRLSICPLNTSVKNHEIEEGMCSVDFSQSSRNR